MSIYDVKTMGETIKGNPYVGRGIVIGKTADGTRAAVAYFIMGRSENSRNRVFKEDGSEVIIFPFDASKVEDPSLIIYSPIKMIGKTLIVTNGDQTQTITSSASSRARTRTALPATATPLRMSPSTASDISSTPM